MLVKVFLFVKTPDRMLITMSFPANEALLPTTTNYHHLLMTTVNTATYELLHYEVMADDIKKKYAELLLDFRWQEVLVDNLRLITTGSS